MEYYINAGVITVLYLTLNYPPIVISENIFVSMNDYRLNISCIRKRF